MLPSPQVLSRALTGALAVEDTLELPALFHMSEIELLGQRLEIGDIVNRCIESEERLRESIESLVYTRVRRTS